MIFRILSVLFLVLCFKAHASSDLIQVEQGTLQGSVEGQVIAFKGIPYAAPPVGELRWRSPHPPASWEGIRPALQFGFPCVQTAAFDPRGNMIGNEDCLTLNIWTPTDARGPLPVLFFVHGGAFYWGSSSWVTHETQLYDGAYLAEHGNAVVVTMNYRLGAFGFLSHLVLSAESGHGTSGNYGLEDQIEALKWVQKNIAAFGGDPSRVLLFGESAGAMSTLGLLVSPLAKDLFSRALMESGAHILGTLAESEVLGQKLAAGLNCADTLSITDCMRSRPAQEVMNALPYSSENAFGPVVDGYVIPNFPIYALRMGLHAHVPFVIGTNEKEMTVLAHLFGMPKMDTEDQFRSYVQSTFGVIADSVMDAYPVSEYQSPAETYYALNGDLIFQCPARMIARAMAETQTEKTYRYLFTRTFHSGPLRNYGPGHALELLYVFHNFYKPAEYDPDSDELGLSDRMVKLWSQFATTGEFLDLDSGAGSPYDGVRDPFIRLDRTISEGERIRPKQCDFWDRMTGSLKSTGFAHEWR